jgi:hypothetical protein
MAPRFALLPLIGALLGICVHTAAYADPILVSSGQVYLRWGGPTSFNMSGARLELGGLFLPLRTSPQQLCFTGCAPGTHVDFSALIGEPSESLPGRNYIAGSTLAATVDGITYPELNVALTGTLVFDAPTVVLPPSTPLGPVTITAPFMFHSQVTGFALGENDSPLFAVDLIGSGTVEVRFLDDSPMLYAEPEVTYVFAATSPVPEPASAFLLATGMAALAGRRYAPRHAKRVALRVGSALAPLKKNIKR